MKILWSILILWLIPSLLPDLRADVSAERLAEIPSAMETAVAAGHAAGVVTLVMKDGKVVHHAATGFADREKQTPMSKDSVFWIASMTKSISATTILTLVDDGKLSLDEPASKWLPELGQMKLANGQPPSRPITLRDLLSHTSGLAFPPRKPTDGAHSLTRSAGNARHHLSSRRPAASPHRQDLQDR